MKSAESTSPSVDAVPPVTSLLGPRALRHLWIVVRPSGERHFIEKEPLEGIMTWARGQEVIVLEYWFHKMIYPRPGSELEGEAK
jgi:hypothetical protein